MTGDVLNGQQVAELHRRQDERYSLATPEDLARWVRLSEYCRSRPAFTEWLQQKNPEKHARLLAGLELAAHRQEHAEWRSDDPLLGGRPEQLLPGTAGSFSTRTDWTDVVYSGGRGGGKSRAGSESIKELLYGTTWTHPPRAAFVGRALDAVRVEMFENGFLRVIPPHVIRQWKRTTCELEIYVPGGQIANIKGYSSSSPDRLRGPNFHLAWADELASFKDANRSPSAVGTTLSNLHLGVRVKHRDPAGRMWVPRKVFTTTPRPVRSLRNHDTDDAENPGLGLYDRSGTVVSTIPTLRNLRNLADSFYTDAVRPLKGTRLWDQEVMGELVDAHPGALWSHELVAHMRTEGPQRPDTLHTVGGGIWETVVAVDPTTGFGKDSNDECGIIVLGRGRDGNVYVLADRTIRGQAGTWAKVVVDTFNEFNAAAIVAETNQGGTMIIETIGRYDDTAAGFIRLVDALGQNKVTRADPVAVMCEQGRVRLCGRFIELERQLVTVDGKTADESDDRLDAFVYGVSHMISVFGTAVGEFRVTSTTANAR